MNGHLGRQRSDSDASPLSLLVHAADAQNPRIQNQRNGHEHTSQQGNQLMAASNAEFLRRELQEAGRLNGAPALGSLEEQLMQRHAAARAESALAGAHGLLQGLPRGLEGDIFQQNATLAAHAQQQQQQQAAAMALASDIRSAMAAAQIRQAAQFQNQDLLLARAAAQHQRGALGLQGVTGLDQLQELEIQRLEELERRQLMASAGLGGANLAAAAAAGGGLAKRQIEMHEAQLRQDHLDREMKQNSMLAREGLRQEVTQARMAATENPIPITTSSNSKEHFQKTPGSVVVPCRARGMPMDHNFKTAYFVIPENVEHGEELICSYFACRNAGIKFRYCTHCKVPVAKRNFRKRHKHGKAVCDVDANDDEHSIDETGPAGSTPPSIHIVKQETKPAKLILDIKQEEPAKAIEIAPSVKVKETINDPVAINDKTVIVVEAPRIDTPKVKEVVSLEQNPTKQDKSKKSKSNKSKKQTDAKDFDAVKSANSKEAEQPDLPPIPKHKSPSICVERERRWATLLAKRPPTKDGGAMSGWLMQVLAVSDLDTPLSEKAESPSEEVESHKDIAPRPTNGTKGAELDTSKQTKSTSPPSTAKKDDAAPYNSMSSSQGVLVKKKRPLAVIMNKEEDDDSSKSSEELTQNEDKEGSGGFAEWKDRKKHKGLAKK